MPAMKQHCWRSWYRRSRTGERVVGLRWLSDGCIQKFRSKKFLNGSIQALKRCAIAIQISAFSATRMYSQVTWSFVRRWIPSVLTLSLRPSDCQTSERWLDSTHTRRSIPMRLSSPSQMMRAKVTVSFYSRSWENCLSLWRGTTLSCRGTWTAHCFSMASSLTCESTL